ncbi:hypothetical protein PHYBOEH_000427, partial [Phytophthora boehmeriae]
MAQGGAAFLTFLAHNFESALDRKMPQMEIRFKDLSIVASVKTNNREASALPSLWNSIKQFVTRNHVTEKQILTRVNVVFKPGTMTLVLGQPGSGKTSLLKTLSGQFPMTKNVSMAGDISYNGLAWEYLLPKLPQLAAYVPQKDEHFASLTVHETLEFAHTCCVEELASQRGKVLLSQGSPQQNEAAWQTACALHAYYPDVVVEQLGLQACRNTAIGDGLNRGVSGGERRRVTTGEMEFGMKYVTFMDEISTGLDSAVTFDIVSTQRDIAKKLHKTVVMALLQPAPEVFELFDNVLLLNNGEVLYNGPRGQVLPYFQTLGFECPPDRDVADFLLDLATDQQQQYEVVKTDSRLSRKTPRLASDFAKVFRRSTIHQATLRALDRSWDIELLHDAKQHIATMPEFRRTFWNSTMGLIRRHLTISFRNRSFIFVRAFMAVGGGIVFGSAFFKGDLGNVQVALGILYQSTIYLAMGQSSELASFITARALYYKHRRANFYRSSSFVIASLVAVMPTIVGEGIVFGSLIYWMCGFVAEVGHFLFFLVCMVLTSSALCSWFLAVAAVSPNLNIAESISTFSDLFFCVFAGFVVPRTQIPSFLAWVYWVNPVSWCLRSVAVSQYRSPRFDKCIYDGADYCTQFNMTVGEYLLSQYDVPAGKEWIWVGVIYLIFANAVFITLAGFILEHKRYDISNAHTPEEAHHQGRNDKNQIASRQKRLRDETEFYTVFASARSTSNTPVLQSSSDDFQVVDVGEEQTSFTPVSLAFKNLWYSVTQKSESIDLLKGISGYALPGTMTALMGSSGAGKTTLLDVIAGRKTGGSIRGDILLNGYPATELAIRRCTGYCEQQDSHTDGVTIREALVFSAFLRQPSNVSTNAKLASVEECLTLLDMTSIADQMVRGRTQEQVKRLTIGVELVAQPSILFLDEPTSGLDARSAKMVMNGVRKVANSGRTVLCTIHQPSSEVFFLFDSLLLLKHGGEMVFFGELENIPPDLRACGHLIDYFEDIPTAPRLPAGQNPATWMLECIGAGVGTNENRANVDFIDYFRGSQQHQTLQSDLDWPGIGKPVPKQQSELVFTKKRASNSMMQFRLLLTRFLTIYWRSSSYNLTRIVISLGFGLVFGLVLVGGEYSTYQGINSAVGMILMTTLYLGNASFYGALPFTAQERASFYRERAAQTYNVLWYFVAATVTEIP